jgi:short subunit dehydrogenase-like uncharacterized protein
MGAGAGVGIAAAQIPPLRKQMLRLKGSGEGPSEEERRKAWFKVMMKGEGGDQRIRAQVSGGDPGYGETSKMLGEAGLCLAHDELPEHPGQVTPAVAMGEALIVRLQQAGIKFEVLEER